MGKINFIDLFAGAGGLSEGFIQNGFNPVAHVEMSKDACLTLQTRASYHYLNKSDKLNIYRQYLSGEITREELYSMIPDNILNSVINTTMSSENMPMLLKKIDSILKNEKVKKVSLIVGGPPCQAYSLVGRAVSRTGMKKDPRNYLYKLYCDVLKKYQPDMFVFENVPGLLTANGGKYFCEMVQEFESANYVCGHRILNAFNFGVLQQRRRIIIIGWRRGLNYKYPEFSNKLLEGHVGDILNDLPVIQSGGISNKYSTNKYSEYLKRSNIRKPNDVLTWHIARPNIERDREIYRNVIETWNNDKRRLKYTELPDELCTHKNKSAFLDRFKVVAADLPASHTMMAHISKDGHYFIHPDIKQARSITVRESARIQSFPDDYYFEGSRTAVFTQIGNAVPPLMARAIAKQLKTDLKNISTD